MDVDVDFIDREGCHLCAEAWPIVAEVAAAKGVPVRRLDVDADPELQARYSFEVPVVLVNGEQHAFYRVDAGRFAAALDRALAAE